VNWRYVFSEILANPDNIAANKGQRTGINLAMYGQVRRIVNADSRNMRAGETCRGRRLYQLDAMLSQALIETTLPQSADLLKLRHSQILNIARELDDL
jgi:hypothetical protein